MIWQKIVGGAPERNSRLHDEHGNSIPTSRLVRNGPSALLTGLARVIFGYRVRLPWISYDARREIAKHLSTASSVLEFGSGVSTLWYARTFAHVDSVENHIGWFTRVEHMIKKSGVQNVRLRLALDVKAYAAVESDAAFDLIMIDGAYRDACAENAIRAVKPGGIIYLDNSDKGPDSRTGDVPAARRLLINFAKERGATVTLFTDFAPTQLFVQEGLMIKLPRAGSQPGQEFV